MLYMYIFIRNINIKIAKKLITVFELKIRVEIAKNYQKFRENNIFSNYKLVNWFHGIFFK